MNKKIVIYLFGFFVFFIIYNTLMPFDFDISLSTLSKHVHRISWNLFNLQEENISLTDIVGNVLLFIPFGFLLYMLFHQRATSHPILFTVIAGASLSFFVEFFQLFIYSRDSALHDLFNNTLGSWIGAVIASIYSLKAANIVRKIFYELLDRKPFLLIVVIIGLAQSIAAVMPFTVSISVSSLKDSIKDTNLIPFAYKSINAIFLNHPDKLDKLPFDITPMIENIVFWAVAGYLLMICYNLYWKHKSWGRIVVWGVPLFYFFLLEFGQLFITSRITDINDIISGYGGIVAGYAIFHFIRPVRKQHFEADLRLLKIPLMIYAIFILFAGLRPFDWSLNSQIIARDLTIKSLVPFYAYFQKTSLWNIFDIINSLTYFLPISLYWSYTLKERGIPYSPIYVITTIAGLALGAFIELSQLFSAERIAEITDILLYGGGGALGTFLIYYFERQVVPTLDFIRRGRIKLGPYAEKV